MRNFFLAFIVKTDIVHIKEALTASLAVSLRFDGSVDRTKRHNVFVMVQVVTKDATMCLGLDIPKTKGAIGCLYYLKKITRKILPWEDLFELMSSLVTDVSRS